MRRALLIWAALALACGKSHPETTPDAGSDAGPTTDGGSSAGDGGIPIPEVKVKALLPASGPTGGGGTSLITGSGFVQGFALHGGADVSKLTSVAFAAAAATDVSVIDDNRIEGTVPPGSPGPAGVKGTNPNGSGTCAGCYRYVPPGKVLSADPPSAPTPRATPVTSHRRG